MLQHLPARRLSLVLVAVVACMAHAQQLINVPAAQPTIQAGIDAAQNGDTVVVAPGTYTENIDFKGKNITVTSGATSYGEAANTVIQASAGAVVSFQTGETSAAVLNGFTITHVGSETSDATGAGVLISGASPVISNNIITGSNACGIGVEDGAGPLIEGNDIRGATNGTCDSERELAIGAGVTVYNGTKVQILGNTIENNVASGCGSGINASQLSTLSVQNNIIRFNQGLCSALFLRGIQQLNLIQNLIYGNTAQLSVNNPGLGAGGNAGIYIDTLGSPPSATYTQEIVSNTVYGNVQLSTAGVNEELRGEQLFVAYAPTSSVMENNIFGNSDSAIQVYCSYPGVYGFNYNDSYTGYTGITEQNCSPNGTGNISVDPQFTSIASGNFHLLATSPAVAAGTLSAPDLPSTDLDGLSRIYNGAVGLGVYEYHPPSKDTLTLASSVNPSYAGQSVTFTVTVNPVNQVAPLSGTVSFYDGATLLNTVALPASGTTAISTASLAVGSHAISATYSGDTDQLASTSNTVTQLATLQGTSIALTSSENPASFGQKVTFAATVLNTSNGRVIPGTLNFFDGTTLIGSVPLNNGMASFSDSTLAVGTHAITAQYAATSIYQSATSNVISEQIVSDFSLSVSPDSHSVYPGGAASYTVTLTPNTGFTLPVALSCANLPAETTCSFSPASVTGSGGISKLTIQTSSPHSVALSARSARNTPPPRPGWKTIDLCGILLLSPLCSLRGRRYLAMLCVLALGCVTGCGNSGPVTGGTPPGTYSISVVGTSTLGDGETLAHAASANLVVKPPL